MEMLLEWFWRNNFLLSLLIMETSLCAAFPTKKNAAAKGVVTGLLLLLLSSLVIQAWRWDGQTIVAGNIISNVVWTTTLALLSAGRLYWCYDISLWNSLFLATLSVTGQQTCFSIYKIIEMIFMGPGNIVSPGWPSVLLNLCVLLPGSWLAYHLFRGNNRMHLQVTDQDKRLIVWAWVVLTLHDYLDKFLFVNDPYANTGHTMIAFRASATLFSVVAVYMLYNLLARRALEMEQVAMQAISRQRSLQYAFSQDLIDSLNIRSHDLKKQIRYLRRDGADKETLLSELESISDSMDTVFHTKSEALNTVLSEKSLICYHNRIPFSCLASGEGLEFMRDLDIYTLFANLLDNAIEASLQVEEGERNIFVVIKKKENFISIHAENVFKGEVIRQGDELLTTKSDKQYHGFGVRSMREIAERYGGVLTCKVQKNTFTVNILLLIPEKE